MPKRYKLLLRRAAPALQSLNLTKGSFVDLVKREGKTFVCKLPNGETAGIPCADAEVVPYHAEEWGPITWAQDYLVMGVPALQDSCRWIKGGALFIDDINKGLQDETTSDGDKKLLRSFMATLLIVDEAILKAMAQEVQD